MRKFASFLPVFSLLIIFLTHTSCERQSETRKIYKSLAPRPSGPVVKPMNFKVKESMKPDTAVRPLLDSLKNPSDSLHSIKDSVIFSREQVMDSTSVQVEPLRKPTFRHFYKYMHLYRKSPVS